ncbi:hypothetical protein SERLADRAFT_348468 [Serpula lacrymans var. lacrymans S7.9]|uniref:Metallo-beta-lactamase domain-containing protein n=1 Tax=Serpula lacrymans var. lacrymans (strain S7.9) TaxID=578457 RepID=F8NTB2_SERL9|nr:uncharacterized protein SERLADRAFT_348468 [Serpula lacrymans var. lacrymans S7.9]EGO25584.1 hypothetical protein SERLADRAFT_348468 [Serpula lacrymans var. lacrymans S7.9]
MTSSAGYSSSPQAFIQSVDTLTITFLVDNCIEWMTKLPPGFTHEMRQHLVDHSPPKDPRTGVPMLDFERLCCGAHGFSALIETQTHGFKRHLTLFDTGPDSSSLVRNIDSMRVPVNEIDRVVLSHWHSDHTGGLLSFLRLRGQEPSPCIVDAHPSRPIARGIAPPPAYESIIGRLPNDPTFALIEEAGGKIEYHTDGHAVADDTIWVSGEIPRLTPFEDGLPGGMRWVEEQGEGRWVQEHHIMDERYVAIDVYGKGLVILSACSHAGIVNVVKDATSKFSRPIHMERGLHLAGPELTNRISPTVEFLSQELRPAPMYILPMHCSGFQAKIALETAFGEGCVPAGVGIKVDVLGNREVNKRMMYSAL